MTLRILYVSAEPVPGVNGGSVHTHAVASGLARRGHAVTLLTRREPGQPAAGSLDGIRVLRAPLTAGGKTVPLLALGRLLALDPRGFDVVMARFSALGGAEGCFAGRACLPLVLEVNSPQVAEVVWRHGLEGSLAAAVLEAWERSQFRRAAAVITPSVRIVPEEARPRCRLVSWGCDPDRFRPAEREDTGRFVVAFSGSFRSWHGVDLLPKVAKALLAKVPEAVFLCVGDGEERPSVEAQAKALGVSEAFRFTGAVPPEAVPGYLGSAHAGIAPFRIAGYPPFAQYGFFYSPLKIFEYMACGLPVLATDCPELAAVVTQGRTGRLCPEGDAAAMAAVLAAWARDPALRRAMGEAARKEAETRFSWQVHAAGVEAILEEVTGARRA